MNVSPATAVWLGHAVGALIFGTILYLLARDVSAARLPGRTKALLAAALGLTWNAAQFASQGGRLPWVEALASCALSLMPAVLLDLVVRPRVKSVRAIGYALSAAAMGLHLIELRVPSGAFHSSGLMVIAFGFGVLAVYSAIRGLIVGGASLALFLFALSFLHFAGEEPRSAWLLELLIHHAGIPLAMVLLLHDYRFVLLDGWIRVMANVVLAAGFAWCVLSLAPESTVGHLALLAAGMMLFAFAAAKLQTWLTQIVFARPDVRALAGELDTGDRGTADESDYLDWAGARIANFFGAELIGGPVETTEPSLLRTRYGVEAVLPIRVNSSETRRLFFGRRQGGRRYLSEDQEVLAQMGQLLENKLERRREEEMRRLMSQAELRALQAQIHPHFLFNALNTLYGIIPKEAAGARSTVLNLADVFRYFLQSQRTYVPLREELDIVRAYLEIESLRLGSRLRIRYDIDDALLAARIPLLSVQPLVENAVKHGVASRVEGGEVEVRVREERGAMHVTVRDTGPGFSNSARQGLGVGLTNVRRRLELCYGEGCTLTVASSTEGAEVGFAIPGEAVR